MTTSTLSTPAADLAVKEKLSWKLPITFALAALLVMIFAVKASGDTLVRLNDRRSAFTIPDFSVPVTPTL